MRVAALVCGLSVLVALAAAGPIVKRAAEGDISPLNEVYVFQNDDDAGINDDDSHGDREKRKIGVIKLGVSNGIINFVFGKLDAFLDAKTRAITVLDEGNKAKNLAFGIDPTHSATSEFISKLVTSKIQAGTSSIGPLINSATTFLSGAKNGISGAFASKLAPLTSIVGGLSGGSGGAGGAGAGNIIGSLLSGLSAGSGGLGSLSGGGSSNGDDDGSFPSDSSSSSGVGGGASLNAFANIGGGKGITTTTEDTPEFDRTHVSLAISPPAIGTGFALITKITKILNSFILNSAHRTQSLLEVFKPFFRGAFAIKGLPSDRVK